MNLIAIVVFAAAVARCIHLARWEENLKPFAYAALGALCVIASDEVAEWTGRYGFTRQQWWTYPARWVRAFGGAALIIGTIQLLLR